MLGVGLKEVLFISQLVVVWRGVGFLEKSPAFEFEGYKTYISAFKLFCSQQLFVRVGAIGDVLVEVVWEE